MTSLNEKFMVDGDGRRVGVVLDMKAYRKVLAALEELDCIRAYDTATNSGDKAIPFGRAVAEIEGKKKRK